VVGGAGSGDVGGGRTSGLVGTPDDGRADTLLGMHESPSPAPARPTQTRAVVLLALALTALLALWGIGGYLLYTRAPADFGEPPQGTPSPSARR
jgi:hypothetical protein